MINLKVYWDDEYGCTYESKVYCIDSVRDRFLVVDRKGHFVWVSTDDCELMEEDE